MLSTLNYCLRAAGILPRRKIDFTSLPSFHYEPLSDPMNTRVLVLQPGRKGDDLSCHLEEMDLRNNPDFEALSYTWGEPTPQHAIRCGVGRLDITTNLFSALSNLRLPYAERRLWADAICINQHDIPERSLQVRNMANIYADARRTLVWLGEETAETRGAFEAIRTVRRWFPSGPLVDIPSPEEVEKVLPNADRILDEIHWDPVFSVLSHSWFQRKWIIQEVVKSKNVVLLNGSQCIDWPTMTQTIRGLMSFGITTMIQDRPVKPRTTMGWVNIIAIAGIHHEGAEFSELLLHTATFLCTDPRDQFFAMYGLANDKDSIDPGLRPDYSISLKQLMLRYVSWSIKAKKTLNFLAAAERRSSEPSRPYQSWLPILSRDFPVTSWPIEHVFNASNSTDLVANIEEGTRVLRITGRQIGAIHILASEFNQTVEESKKLLLENPKAPIQIVCLLTEWRTIAMAESDTLSPEALAGFARTAVWDVDFKSTKRRPADFPKVFARYVELVTGTVSEFEGQDAIWRGDEDLLLLADIDLTLLATSLHRRFCRTTSGALGQVPGCAQVGDMICVFHGGKMPYVVRPCGNGEYSFIGVCYLDGFMDGEAMAMDVDTEEFLLV